MKTENLQSCFSNAPQYLQKRGAGSPQHQTSLDARLHLLQQMLHVGLKKKAREKKLVTCHRFITQQEFTSPPRGYKVSGLVFYLFIYIFMILFYDYFLIFFKILFFVCFFEDTGGKFQHTQLQY